MLKLFPLPSFLEKFSQQRVVNVAIFGNGLSLSEWAQLNASFWHRYNGFTVNLVDESSEADILAVHGPFTPSSWPFFEQWINARTQTSKVLAVGAEVHTQDGHILDYQNNPTEFKVDAILPGHPPTPGAIKESLLKLMSQAKHV